MPSPARANGASVVKFKPVAVKNKPLEEAVAEIARGVNALHECVHAGHEAQASRDAEADRKREELAGTVGGLVGRLDVMEGTVSTLGKMFGAQKAAPGEKPPKGTVRLGIVEHLKVLGVVGSCLTLLVFSYKLLAALFPAFHQFMMGVQT